MAEEVEMKAWDDCTLKEKVERWERVISILQKLTPHQRRKHWDMETFGRKEPCGTVACAAGHAGMNPWFRKRGFRMDFVKLTNYDGTVARDDEGHIMWDAEISDTYRFFGDGADSIFWDPSHRSVSQVIKEIRDHVKSIKAEEAEESA